MFVPIHIMWYEGNDIFTVERPAVAVELKVARSIAYPKSVAYEHNQVLRLFNPKDM